MVSRHVGIRARCGKPQRDPQGAAGFAHCQAVLDTILNACFHSMSICQSNHLVINIDADA
jgi:hypothetical protein